MPSVLHVLQQSQQPLKLALAISDSEARLEARILLAHALQVSHAWLISHANDALEANIHAVFEALLNRRLQGEPIAYILGHREFYGLNLAVTSATLIPRPDTETLVEAALEKIPQDSAYQILDLGTGSGAIALAIAKHRPQAMVTAVDASPEALVVASSNAQRLALDHVTFLQSDWFATLQHGNADQFCPSAKFDIIVSNPPYIAATDEHLSQGDLRHEPLTALASGTDGLDDIRRIIDQAPQHLNHGGWLMLEHGYDQSAAVAALMAEHGFGGICHRQDIAGIDRVTCGQWPGRLSGKSELA